MVDAVVMELQFLKKLIRYIYSYSICMITETHDAIL